MSDALLKTVSIFSGVDPAEANELQNLLHPEQLEVGRVLFREKTPGEAMWILAGAAEVSISATPPNATRPVVIGLARAGETVGEMALIDEGPRSATAVVTSAGPAARLEAAEFRPLRTAFHPVAYKVLRQICRELCTRLRTTSARIAPSATVSEQASGLVGASRHASAAEIEQFEPFRALPQVVKLALTQKLRPLHTDFDERIFSEGAEGDCAYFLVDGEVRVQRNGQVLASLKPGAMFGLISVIDEGRRSADCVSDGPVRLLQLSKADFDSLFSAGNRFAFQIVDLVCRQLVTHLRAANELVRGPGSQRADRRDFPRGMAVGSESEIIPLELELEMETAAPALSMG